MDVTNKFITGFKAVSLKLRGILYNAGRRSGFLLEIYTRGISTSHQVWTARNTVVRKKNKQK